MRINPDVAKNNVCDALRRHVCKVLVESGLAETIVNDKRSTRYHLVPEYVLDLPGDLFGESRHYFAPVSLKQKGKRRVYCNAGFNRTKDTLYISYLSKSHLVSIGSPMTATSLGDRWVLSVGKPAISFKNNVDMLEHLLGAQVHSSRDNKPACVSEPWMLLSRACRLLINSTNNIKMICTVRKYGT